MCHTICLVMLLFFCHTSFGAELQKLTGNYFPACFNLTIDTDTGNFTDQKTNKVLTKIALKTINPSKDKFHYILYFTKEGWNKFTQHPAAQTIHNITVGDAGVTENERRITPEFLTSLSQLPNLTGLNLILSPTDGHFSKICSTLGHNATLTLLRLELFIPAQGATAQTIVQQLLLGLTANRTLAKFALGVHTDLVNSSSLLDMDVVGAILQHNPNLKTLSFWGDILNPNNISRFTEIIKHNSTLTHLNVATKTTFSADTLNPLLAIPQTNNTLQKLHVWVLGGNIASSTYRTLVDAVINNLTLIEYFFDATNTQNSTIDNKIITKAKQKVSEESLLPRTMYVNHNPGHQCTTIRIINNPVATDIFNQNIRPNHACLVITEPNSMLD
jgi:hypothetical protein